MRDRANGLIQLADLSSEFLLSQSRIAGSGSAWFRFDAQQPAHSQSRKGPGRLRKPPKLDKKGNIVTRGVWELAGISQLSDARGSGNR